MSWGATTIRAIALRVITAILPTSALSSEHAPLKIPLTGDLYIICGGPGEGGETNRSRKAHARAAQQEIDPTMYSLEVNQVFRLGKGQRCESLDLIFTDTEAELTLGPHDDALVVTLTLAGLNVHRILVDNKSLVNVLYKQVQR